MAILITPSVMAQLPAGTVVALHSRWVWLSFTWESAQGLHIVRTRILYEQCHEPCHAPELQVALRLFSIAIALEALGEDCGS